MYPEYFTRCRILPAQPHIHIASGRQTDELIIEKDPEKAAAQKRVLEYSRYDIVPAHMLAPDNHDTLVREHHDANTQRLLHFAENPIFIHDLIKDPTLKPLVIEALEQACIDKGITEKYEDQKFRRKYKFDWLLKQLSAFTNDSREYYAIIAKTCMASEHKKLFLDKVEEALDHACAIISSSVIHTDDEVHKERELAFRRCFVVDPSNGTIHCDPIQYPHLVDIITDENSQAYEKRIAKLRTKMQREAEYLDSLVNNDPKTITSLKRNLRRQGVHIGDNPFSKPLSQEEAIDAVFSALEKINAPHLVERLMEIALRDENLVISVSNTEKHIENIYGNSLDERKSRYVMGSSGRNVIHLPKNPDTWTLVEELTHHALRLIYENDCKPYKKNNDQRKTLYFAAIKEDFSRSGMVQAKKDFELATYKLNSFSCEIIAKSLAMMASGDWDAIKDHYPIIERHIHYMLTRDIDTYEKFGHVEAYGTHTIKAATISSGTHANARPHGSH